MIKHLFIIMLISMLFTIKIEAQTSVSATAETDPVHSGGDAADDACIWIHPTDTILSTIIATDKQAGLVVYDLAGNEIQFVEDGKMNNVDIRYNFPLDGATETIVAASNRSNNSIAVYRINPGTRFLENITDGTISTGITVYGFCMYHSPISDNYYCFINSTSGEMEQWEIFDNGSGLVTGTMVRSFDVGGKVEGCVADDVTADFYIGEESIGIWKYGAKPGDGTARTLVDSTWGDGHLTADVEGLTIYYTSSGQGYLLASSQGSNEFVVYERIEDNDYVMTFNIVAGNGIDGVSDTDGIDVTNFNLGSAFPQGVFVAQNGSNPGSNQNFKLVPWQDIANSVDPPLVIDTSWDPRKVGMVQSPVTVNVKVFLEGPYGAGAMSTDLGDNSLLPYDQPYSSSPWNYNGTESVTTIPSGVVDWVLVELRTNIESSSLAATRAAFIKSDGKVVDIDGTSPVSFFIKAGDYYIVIRHRNHLSIMSANPISLSESSDLYDFTIAQSMAYGTNPMKELEAGVFGMLAGDGNSDGGVDALDKNLVWRPQNGTTWEYTKYGDFNLDGGIDALDLNLKWRPNNGTGTQVPE